MTGPPLQASDGEEEDYESTHVHRVYDQIAPHFSATRYKPWPLISAFLSALPTGSIGLDAGCGNGKYLNVNPNIYILASDTSLPLLQIAHGNNGSSRSFDHVSTPSRDIRRPPPSSDVFQSSTLFLPHPSSRLDFAISIAVIHHLSTRSRRVEAVRAMLEVLKPWKSPASTIVGAKSKAENGVKGKDEDVERIRRLAASEIGGVLLVFVWALEQKGSRRGWDQGMEQDVMVPWVMKSGGEGETNRKKRVQRLEGSEGEKAQEYGGNVGCVSGKDAMAEVEDKEEASRDKTFYRYYHLYKRGELEADVEAAGGKVLDGGWERDNWWVIAVRE